MITMRTSMMSLRLKRKLAKKKAIGKAKRFFNEQKGKTIQSPLSQVRLEFSDEQTEEALEAYNQYIEQAKTSRGRVTAAERREGLFKKTDEVFSGVQRF